MFLLVYVIHGYDSFRLPWRLCCCCLCCAFYVHDDVCDGLLHTDRTDLRCYKDKFFFIVLCLRVYIFMMIVAYVYAIISDYIEHMFLLNMLCISCRHSWLCLWTHRHQQLISDSMNTLSFAEYFVHFMLSSMYMEFYGMLKIKHLYIMLWAWLCSFIACMMSIDGSMGVHASTFSVHVLPVVY